MSSCHADPAVQPVSHKCDVATVSSTGYRLTMDHDDRKPLRYTTAREMLAGGYRVDVWCPRCKIWREISLVSMVRARRGDESLIGRTWRCRVCAEVGQMHLRPAVKP